MLFKSTLEIRKLLSKEKDPPVRAVLGAGILPRLVELLATGEPRLQFEAAWAITNIASTEFTSAVVEVGAIPVLVHLMMSPSPDVREQCAWCLGNIAGDGPRFRDLVLNTPGAAEHLMLNIQHPHNDSMLKNCTWTLSNYCRGKPQVCALHSNTAPCVIEWPVPVRVHVQCSWVCTVCTRMHRTTDHGCFPHGSDTCLLCMTVECCATAGAGEGDAPHPRPGVPAELHRR